MEKQNNNFKLADLMNAEQALKIIDLLENLEKRVENLENENRALRAEQLWAPVYESVKMYAERED